MCLLACVTALGCDLDRLLELLQPPPPASRVPQGARPWSAQVALGAPVDATPQDDIVLTKPQYVVSYNRFRNAPNWVAWRLTAADLGSTGRTQSSFSVDDELPSGVYRVHHGDYANSGYDRGHLCPSAARTDTVEDNAATFLTTNIVPQLHALNAGPWESLEQWCNAMARQGWDLYIIAGGLWPSGCATSLAPSGNYPSGGCYTIGRSGDASERIAVPASTWKVVVLLPHGAGPEAVTYNTTVFAVDMPNDASVQSNWQRYMVPVDAVEARTGYELLSNIPAAVQAVVEARVSL